MIAILVHSATRVICLGFTRPPGTFHPEPAIAYGPGLVAATPPRQARPPHPHLTRVAPVPWGTMPVCKVRRCVSMFFATLRPLSAEFPGAGVAEARSQAMNSAVHSTLPAPRSRDACLIRISFRLERVWRLESSR